MSDSAQLTPSKAANTILRWIRVASGETAAFTDLDILSDYGIRSDLNILADARPRVHNRCFMYVGDNLVVCSHDNSNSFALFEWLHPGHNNPYM